MEQKQYFGFHLHCKNSPIKPIVLQLPVEKFPPPLDIILSEAMDLLPQLESIPIYATLEQFLLNEAGEIIGQFPGTINSDKKLAIIFERNNDGLQCIDIPGNPKCYINNNGLNLNNNVFDITVLRLY